MKALIFSVKVSGNKNIKAGTKIPQNLLTSSIHRGL
jgi:hypothetical protein